MLSPLARIGALAILILIHVCALMAQAPVGQTPNGQTAGQKPVVQEVVLPSNGAYRLGPNDVIKIQVLKQDLLTQDAVRIGNDGNIRLAMVDEPVRAACFTEAELAAIITEGYRKYLLNPQVLISTREFNSNSIAVIGAVNSPGRFQLQRPYRLVELLSLVNGPSQAAGTSVEILRYGNQPYCDGNNLIVPSQPREEIMSVSLMDTFKGGETANPLIMPGDIIRVPQAELTNAYIQGNVRNGMAIPLKEPVSLTQAVAMAGGVTSGAQLDKVRIRRPIPGSINRSEILVNLKEINKGTQDDILLQANDIVEIPGPTGVKKIFSDIYKTVVPTITGLPMRVIY